MRGINRMSVKVGLLTTLLWATGPPLADAGINVWTTNGPKYAIFALAVDPLTPSTLYAGTELGGVFKSTNGGGSWSAANSGLPNYHLVVEALAVDPAAPNTIYVGVWWRTPAFTTEVGLFKSTDGGESWSAMNWGLRNGRFNLIYALAVDPLTPSTLYAGTLYGVSKSTDGGWNWTEARAGLPPPTHPTYAVAVDPVTPSTLYAGLADVGIYKSTNGGETWNRASDGLPDTSVRTLAIDPLTPSTLYAGTWSAGVFKSTNGGRSWTAANSGLPSIYFLGVGALVIDPLSPSTLYAGAYSGDASHSGGVFKSTDGGASWSGLNVGLTDTQVDALALDPLTPTTIYAGTAGGVFALQQSVRLVNISTRGQVGTGDNVLIGGFIIEGTVAKTVLIRARGPSMSGVPFSIPGTVADPFLQIFSGSTVIAQNNDWQTGDPLCASMGFTCGEPTEIAPTGLDPCRPNPEQSAPPPGCAQESAILITLPPGPYTAMESGVGGGTGIGLVEIFEVDGGTSPSKLANISTRGRVDTGDNVMIGGFIIAGSSPKTVLIRARGPSMSGAPFFVPGTLANPFLGLFSGQTAIAFNDNWQDLQPEDITATGLDPCEPNPGQTTAPVNCAHESAIVLGLPPGAYTAIVTGIGGGTGVGLVEVFEVNDVPIPNVAGNYAGSGTVTQSGCQNPGNNGNFGFASTANIGSQNGSIFIGTGTLTGITTINLAFSGTATAGADLMGSFTFTSAIGSGNGTFIGSVAGDGVAINFSGQVTSGETCVVTGSLSGKN